MTGQKEQIASTDASNSASTVIFGPVPQTATPNACRHENSRSGTADAPNSDADAFFRANPDALLEGLLTETLAVFGDPTPD
ncbi:MAG: hypothetical protein ACYDHY_14320 [Acidiferrobacterales bacterium]